MLRLRSGRFGAGAGWVNSVVGPVGAGGAGVEGAVRGAQLQHSGWGRGDRGADRGPGESGFESGELLPPATGVQAGDGLGCSRHGTPLAACGYLPPVTGSMRCFTPRDASSPTPYAVLSRREDDTKPGPILGLLRRNSADGSSSSSFLGLVRLRRPGAGLGVVGSLARGPASGLGVGVLYSRATVAASWSSWWSAPRTASSSACRRGVAHGGRPSVIGCRAGEESQSGPVVGCWAGLVQVVCWVAWVSFSGAVCCRD